MSLKSIKLQQCLVFFIQTTLIVVMQNQFSVEAGRLPLTLVEPADAPEAIGAPEPLMQAISLKNLLAQRTKPQKSNRPAALAVPAKTANTALDFKGYIEYKPNGTLILRDSRLDNTSNTENLLLFKSVLKALKLVKPFRNDLDINNANNSEDVLSKLQIKIYGEGVEHRFPPFLERIIQRIQTYFSVYKHTDTSRPLSEFPIPIISPSGLTTSATTALHNGGGFTGSTSVQSNLLFEDTPYAHTTQKMQSTSHLTTKPSTTTVFSPTTTNRITTTSTAGTTSSSTTSKGTTAQQQHGSTTLHHSTTTTQSKYPSSTTAQDNSSTSLTIDDDYSLNDDYISVGED